VPAVQAINRVDRQTTPGHRRDSPRKVAQAGIPDRPFPDRVRLPPPPEWSLQAGKSEGREAGPLIAGRHSRPGLIARVPVNEVESDAG